MRRISLEVLRSALGLYRISLVITLLILVSLAAGLTPLHESSAQETQLKLAVFGAPATLPADGQSYRSLVVQLQRSDGTPFPAFKDIDVTLTSSNLGVGTAQSKVTMPEESSHVVATLATTLTPGSTTITATSPGLATGSGTISTVIPSGVPVRLSLLFPPPIIPEAGAQADVIVMLLDSSGSPARAEKFTPVFLASSSTPIGTIEERIIMPQGSTFAVAKFTATDKAGSTVITASAAGLQTASSVMTTTGPRPAALSVSIAPSIVPASQAANGTALVPGSSTNIFVRLLDSTGLPVPAPAQIKIELTSSNTTIASLPSFTFILKGKTFVRETVAAGKPGSAVIAATSPGLTTSSASVTAAVAPTVATGTLSMISGIPVLPLDQVSRVIYLQLFGSGGSPAVAKSRIHVTFSSANLEIGAAEASVTLTIGSNFQEVIFTSTKKPGTTTITATASEFTPANLVVETGESVPARFGISAIPSSIEADGRDHENVIVQLFDRSGQAVKAIEDVSVSLFSSDTTIGAVTPTVTIRSGTDRVKATFTSTQKVGTTTITGFVTDFPTVSILLTTFDPELVTLSASIVPSRPLADGSPKDVILLRLLSQGGQPKKAKADIPLSLSSSDLSVGAVAASAIFPKERTFTFLAFTPTIKVGTTTVTIHSQGLTSVSIQLQTIQYANANTTVTASQASLEALQRTTVTGKMLIDGLPVKGAKISWKANFGSFTEEQPTTDSNGMASALYTPDDFGNAVITIIFEKAGYGITRANTTLTVRPLLFSAVLEADKKEIRADGQAQLTVQVRRGNEPVRDANITWSTNIGELSTKNSRTDEAGKATSVFKSLRAGVANVRVLATKKGFSPANSSASIEIKLVPMALTLTPGSKSVTLGSLSNVTASVTSGGTPVDDATLSWITNGTLVEGSPKTKSGVGLAKVNASKVGSVRIQVNGSKPGYQPVSQVVTVTFTAPKPTTSGGKELVVSVTASPVKVGVDKRSNVTVQVKSDDKPVADAKVQMIVNLGSVEPTDAVTDAEGKSSFSFKPKAQGNATIIASAQKDGFTDGIGDTIITIGAASPTSLFGILPASIFGIDTMIVIAAPVVAVAGFLLRRWIRGRKTRGPPDIFLEEEEST